MLLYLWLDDWENERWRTLERVIKDLEASNGGIRGNRGSYFYLQRKRAGQ